jgi:hypothetical protein
VTVSFVIPVRNDAVRLDRCLASIRRNSFPSGEVEIIVADNGSVDDSASVAVRHGATVLSLPTLRLGALRNRAAAAATGRILAFVDADHEIVDTWIAAAVEAFESPDVTAVGAPCWPPPDGTWVQRAYDRLRSHPEGLHRTEWLGSGNLAVRTAAFRDLGGFDTSLETCEDVDLCRRIRGAGRGVWADGRLRNTHLGDPATLADVFRGERWRGRDNIRVSLRPPRSWRGVISGLLPVVLIVATAATVASFVILPWAGPWWLAWSALVMLGVLGLRVVRVIRHLPPPAWPGVILVGLAYEWGRAAAVLGRAAYASRRSGA